MFKLTGSKAKVYVIILFLLTAGLSYYFPGFTIVAGGFLLGIFLTTFIEGRQATILAAAISILIILILFFFNDKKIDFPNAITLMIFQVLLILFSAIVVLYMKNLYRNIRSDKTHMGSLFENATEGILLTNHKGIIVLANPAAEITFGYGKDELIGQPIEILIPEQYRRHHPRLREDFHKTPVQEGICRGQRRAVRTFLLK
jgi:PAS domain-containing protein